MQRRLPVFAALALALAAAAPTAAAQTFAITNAHLVTPGPVGEVENGTVIVRDGRIAAAGAADRKSTRLNSSHYCGTRMPSSACTTNILNAIDRADASSTTCTDSNDKHRAED